MQKGGDYIFSLKGNQGNLFDDVKTYLSESEISTNNDIQPFTDHDKAHGRTETRRCSVRNNVSWLTNGRTEWASIKSIIRIDSTRELHGNVSDETRYYISSLDKITPQKALAAIRSHWAIENSLHWILDVSFGEDQSRIRKHNAPQIMAIIRHIALNLLQLTKAQMVRKSIKGLRKLGGWSNDVLTTILTQKFS